MNLILFFSYLTLMAHIFLFITLIIFLSNKRLFKFHFKNVSKYNLFFAFLVSLIATLGSLSFSEILKLDPCKLCWIQRIFMYPLPIILGILLFKRIELNVLKKYIIALVFLGSIFSAYHYGLQIYGSFFNQSLICSINDVSCSVAYFQLGYITIPLMAFTGFLVIFVLLNFYNIDKKN